MNKPVETLDTGSGAVVAGREQSTRENDKGVLIDAFSM
jgi:hypothetical protein